jgi:uncharacterized damage-inducible protein DinB
MAPGISLEELLAWNAESDAFWKSHFDAHPALLELPCGIDGSPNVQELVRHIWMAELRWAQCVAGMAIIPRADLPSGPLDGLSDLHGQARDVFQRLLDDPTWDWERTITLEYEWLPPRLRTASRRKLAAHALLHSQRHWAQLATLIRVAGYPTGFEGDLIFSSALV